MLDVSVPEPCLQRPGVVAGVGQRVAATVAQHVRVDGERHLSPAFGVAACRRRVLRSVTHRRAHRLNARSRCITYHVG